MNQCRNTLTNKYRWPNRWWETPMDAGRHRKLLTDIRWKRPMQTNTDGRWTVQAYVTHSLVQMLRQTLINTKDTQSGWLRLMRKDITHRLYGWHYMTKWQASPDGHRQHLISFCFWLERILEEFEMRMRIKDGVWASALQHNAVILCNMHCLPAIDHPVTLA